MLVGKFLSCGTYVCGLLNTVPRPAISVQFKAALQDVRASKVTLTVTQS